MRTRAREATTGSPGASVVAGRQAGAISFDALEVLPEPVVVTRRVADIEQAVLDFRIVFANTAALNLAGATARSLVGASVTTLFPAFERSELVRRMAAAGGHSLRSIPYRGVAGGLVTTRYFDVVTVPLGDDLLHVWRDVSAERRLEEELDIARSHNDVSVREAQADVLRMEQDLVRQRAVMKAEHEILESLREAVVPRRLERLPNVQLGTRHRRAGAMHVVGDPGFGGDWYDAFAVKDKLYVVIGDVMGHDVHAGAVMTQLRNAVRSYARQGRGPAMTLTESNRFIRDMELHTHATAICIELDTTTGAIRWAQAGHLPLVIRRGTGVDVAPRPDGMIMGVLDDAEYAEQHLQLESGDLLLCFTDGLIEARDVALDEQVQLLLTIVGNAPVETPQDLCDTLVDVLSPSASMDDDTCVVALEWSPGGSDDQF